MAVVTTLLKTLADVKNVTHTVNTVTKSDGTTPNGFDVTVSGTSILAAPLAAAPTHLIHNGTKVVVVAALAPHQAAVVNAVTLGTAFPPETIVKLFTLLGATSSKTL